MIVKEKTCFQEDIQKCKPTHEHAISILPVESNQPIQNVNILATVPAENPEGKQFELEAENPGGKNVHLTRSILRTGKTKCHNL